MKNCRSVDSTTNAISGAPWKCQKGLALKNEKKKLLLIKIFNLWKKWGMKKESRRGLKRSGKRPKQNGG